MRPPFGLRWWELLPEGVLGLGLGLFLVTEPDAATSAFESGTAIGLMVAVALGWLVGRLALARMGRRWSIARTGIFGVGALAILAVVVLPAYDDETVIETLAVDRVVPDPATTTTTAAGAAPSDPEASTTTTVPPQPRVLARGDLHGIDHRASGTAVVYEQPTGALVVGLEGIDIQPGPDYDVYLVPGADQEDLGDSSIRLDDLRGNKGTQYYEVPAGAAVEPGAWTVLVWCQTFDVPVAGATPT